MVKQIKDYYKHEIESKDTEPIVQPGECKKLKPRFSGPYRIINKHDNVTYSIESLDKSKQLKVHVQRLRSYRPWKSDF